jgi:hypothetical protein
MADIKRAKVQNSSSAGSLPAVGKYVNAKFQTPQKNFFWLEFGILNTETPDYFFTGAFSLTSFPL